MPMTNKNSRPYVKWGSLVIAIILAIPGLIPFILNFMVNFQLLPEIANPDLRFAVGFIAGYGWIISVFSLLSVISIITEDFIPSVEKVKKWEKRKAKERKIRDAENRVYTDFLENFDFSSLH